VSHTINYHLIGGHLYKLGVDGILHRCVFEHEWDVLLFESHEGLVGGHNAGKTTTSKVLCARFGGFLYNNIPRSIANSVMFFIVWGNCIDKMSCLSFM
jgi:hypothetical protein